MATRPVCSFALLALATLIAGPAFAEKGGGKKKEAEIKAGGRGPPMREKEKAAQGDRRPLRTHHPHMDPKRFTTSWKRSSGFCTKLEICSASTTMAKPDHLNYNDDRVKAGKSIERAHHQVEKGAPRHRGGARKAAHDIGEVHEDLSKALAFSQAHSAAVDGTDKKEMERRADEDQRLTKRCRKSRWPTTCLCRWTTK